MTFEQLKRSADEAKQKVSRASGRIDGIKSAWRAKYGTDDIERIKEIHKEAHESLDKASAAIAENTRKAEEILNRVEACL